MLFGGGPGTFLVALFRLEWYGIQMRESGEASVEASVGPGFMQEMVEPLARNSSQGMRRLLGGLLTLKRPAQVALRPSAAQLLAQLEGLEELGEPE